MANFDHLTTDILKFWPWSWSKIFDHLTMTPGRRPNGQKIMVILPPPPYIVQYYTLYNIHSTLYIIQDGGDPQSCLRWAYEKGFDDILSLLKRKLRAEDSSSEGSGSGLFVCLFVCLF